MFYINLYLVFISVVNTDVLVNIDSTGAFFSFPNSSQKSNVVFIKVWLHGR